MKSFDKNIFAMGPAEEKLHRLMWTRMPRVNTSSKFSTTDSAILRTMVVLGCDQAVGLPWWSVLRVYGTLAGLS